MWWLAIPIAVGAGKVIYDAFDNDSSSSSSSYESDRDEREEELLRQACIEKNDQIREEIREYRDSQEAALEKRYSCNIMFDRSEELRVMKAELQGDYRLEDPHKASRVELMSVDDSAYQASKHELSNKLEQAKQALSELENWQL